MSRKMTQYSAEFKTKIVLEVLKGEKTINEISSEYNIIPKNIQNWKNIFLANAVVAMEPARAIKEYKDEIDKLKAKNDEYAKVVGKLTVENNWMSGKKNPPQKAIALSGTPSMSLDSKRRQAIVEFKLSDISIKRQSELLGIARSGLYYHPKINEYEIAIKNHIQAIYNEIPIYGYLKVHKQLLEDGFSVSVNTVHKYRQELGLKAILALKAPYTSKTNREHPIYSYKLKNVEIVRTNQVWSADITYVRIKGGFVYLAAIIDWYSKAVLSWRVSNTMDSDLVMGVLNEALALYPKPEIFNTDQGSQYTSYIHTDTLKQHGITISMNGAGRSIDNICIERFWRSAKVEKIYLNEYDRVSTLKDDVKEYIKFYNHRRFHESLDYKKPMEVYFNGMKTDEKHQTHSGEIVA